MTARSVFLRDQDAAARADAAKTLWDSSAANGVPAPVRHAGPFTTEVVRRLQERCAQGLQPVCEHLGDVPAVAVFIVARPERLLCRPCAAPVAAALEGNDEADCHVCGQRLPSKPFVWALGPLLLTYSACAACHGVEVGT
jgi:hypothetical protein